MYVLARTGQRADMHAGVRVRMRACVRTRWRGPNLAASHLAHLLQTSNCRHAPPWYRGRSGTALCDGLCAGRARPRSLFVVCCRRWFLFGHCALTCLVSYVWEVLTLSIGREISLRCCCHEEKQRRREEVDVKQRIQHPLLCRTTPTGSGEYFEDTTTHGSSGFVNGLKVGVQLHRLGYSAC